MNIVFENCETATIKDSSVLFKIKTLLQPQNKNKNVKDNTQSFTKQSLLKTAKRKITFLMTDEDTNTNLGNNLYRRLLSKKDIAVLESDELVDLLGESTYRVDYECSQSDVVGAENLLQTVVETERGLLVTLYER